ncbi:MULTISPECIES: hypothetical protein [unclassified Streptomyces]|uniref:hypothetical protein n=1 Tax=unclassified Streptomyces TaxID=2593676 RepID=UPI002E34D4F6|nr:MULTISPECIES: hypothetical protein [unclassified Streptomyces]WUC67650.1 hypothetical protein OG861_27425 [Streptomyces sp. NBC_00539]
MSDPHAPEGDDYSATVLGTHWFSGPPEQPDGTGRPDFPTPRHDNTRQHDTPALDTRRLDTPVLDTPQTVPGAAPDRVDGPVLRFGPGVTAAMPAPFPVTVPAAVPGRRPGQWRRYTLAAVVLAGVLAYLGWQRFGPALAVRDVAVTTDPKGPGCDAAADVLAVVRTNGRPGTLTYHWERSDGTRSEQLTERVPSGRKEARLHLLWTFQGVGTYAARAELRLDSPGQRAGAVGFTYRCRA